MLYLYYFFQAKVVLELQKLIACNVALPALLMQKKNRCGKGNSSLVYARARTRKRSSLARILT